MPDLSLRAYHRKIESWIEEDKIDKAISQIAHLLREFPKDIQTWRCLSKALLQKQDFENADQVFDIILKVDPDDFVSHIGKSMAAEHRGDMEVAVDHMRRAFELQPSNEGLQNELKRLIIKNDGVEPTKVRLTRGALIKMYLRGSLYEQAIAEALIGVRENSHRSDYQLALAEGFERTGDYAKSAEICLSILKEFPYCQKANEILQSILSMSSTDDIPLTYQQRLIALDPYYAYVTESTASILDVPDIAVMIEDQSEELPEEINIETIIEESWTNDNAINKEFIASDWQNIIKKALGGTQPDVDFELGDYEEVSEAEMNKVEKEESPQPHSRKENFLEKLRSSSRKEEENRIPEWIFGQDDELIQLSQESDPDFPSDQDIIEDTPEIGQSILEETFPPVFIEPTDLDAESEWFSEGGHPNDIPKESPSTPLEDTQEIQVVDNQPAFMLDIVEKALVGENYQYAMTTLRKLINQGFPIEEVVSRVEIMVQDHPECSDLLIFLGELYTRQGKRAEALAVYKRAQKNILL
jgi:tetratricopeptide (TPR) repeat protein